MHKVWPTCSAYLWYTPWYIPQALSHYRTDSVSNNFITEMLRALRLPPEEQALTKTLSYLQIELEPEPYGVVIYTFSNYITTTVVHFFAVILNGIRQLSGKHISNFV